MPSVRTLVISDQGSNNRAEFDNLKVSENRPYFEVKNSKIFVMYDPPHLIKNIRNNLMSSDLQVGNATVSWKYVKEFFNYDSKLPIKMAPKLSLKHIEVPPFSKMRVKLATQVLSNTVAAGITAYCSWNRIDGNGLVTADFIK